MKLNCIAIDDEPLALGLLNAYINKTEFLNLAGSFDSASEGLEASKEAGIHLLFLDIHMPVMNGIELAGSLSESGIAGAPRIIFSTAYNQFAAESYRVEAIDYLLKPFAYEDFFRAAQRAAHFFEQQQLTDVPAGGFLYVRTGYKQVKVMFDDILYIQGLKDYAVIHLKNQQRPVLTLMTLKSLIEKLPADRFMSVQRSFIVALQQVTSVTTNRLSIEAIDIVIGEHYKTAVKQYFESQL